MITGKLYDWLKWIAQIFLPALGTLYFTIAEIWGLGHGVNIVGTIMAVDLFLGVLLGISQVTYAKQIGQGDLLVEEDETGAKSMRLALDHTPEELATKQEVRFKVKKKRQRRK